LGAELVDDRAADPNARVPVERGTSVGALSQGVDEPERSSRDQVVAKHVRGQLAEQAADDLVHEGHEGRQLFTRWRGSIEARLRGTRLHRGSPFSATRP
jgi:hypothetical protein